MLAFALSIAWNCKVVAVDPEVHFFFLLLLLFYEAQCLHQLLYMQGGAGPGQRSILSFLVSSMLGMCSGEYFLLQFALCLFIWYVEGM